MIPWLGPDSRFPPVEQATADPNGLLAAGGDLSAELGIANQGNSPEVEALRQTILKSCLSHNVVCGILANGKAQIDQRLKEGWRFVTTPSGTAAQ